MAYDQIAAEQRAKPTSTQGDEERAREIWETTPLLAEEMIPALVEFSASVRQEAEAAMRERARELALSAAQNADFLGYKDAAIEFRNLADAIRALP
jgi:hypothetical protein